VVAGVGFEPTAGLTSMGQARTLIGDPSVAIGTPNVALGNLAADPAQRDLPAPSIRDVKDLPFTLPMIKLEHNRICFTAVYAWVVIEILEQPCCDGCSGFRILGPSASDICCLVALVVSTTGLTLALGILVRHAAGSAIRRGQLGPQAG